MTKPMICSMTGFGEAQESENSIGYSLEIRSLNNRYFKSIIKLPEYFQFMESEVEKMLRERLHRGSITYSLRVRNSAVVGAADVNTAALEHYLASIRKTDLPQGVTATVDYGTLLSLPGVFQPPELDDEQRDQIAEVVRRLTVRALDALVQMRLREGEALRRDLVGNCEEIRKLVSQIADAAPQVVQEYQLKLRDRVAMLLADVKLEIDEDSLLREVAIFSDRCDIGEELTRLASHLDQFESLCSQSDNAGRKMDFLTQELLREANTIGSKSNDAGIARHVVEIKGYIDRLKEQIQNVE